MYIVFLQASSTVEVDIQTAEKLLVSRLDFMAALNNDIKPVRCCKVNHLYASQCQKHYRTLV